MSYLSQVEQRTTSQTREALRPAPTPKTPDSPWNHPVWIMKDYLVQEQLD